MENKVHQIIFTLIIMFGIQSVMFSEAKDTLFNLFSKHHDSCGDDFIRLKDNCYYFNESPNAWENAYNMCSIHHANLLSSEDMNINEFEILHKNLTGFISECVADYRLILADQKFGNTHLDGRVAESISQVQLLVVDGRFDGKVWTGLRRISHHLQWVGRYPALFQITNKIKSVFSWEEPSFLRFSSNESLCVVMDVDFNFTLTKAPCHLEYPFVCVRPLAYKHGSPTFIQTGVCSVGWVGHPYLSNACLLIGKEKVTWNDASSKCKQSFSSLVSRRLVEKILMISGKAHGFQKDFWTNQPNQTENKCFIASGEEKPCDHKFLYICENNRTPEIAIRLEATVNKKVKITAPTAWIDDIEHLNIQCKVLIDGKVIIDEQAKFVIYSRILNGVYYTDKENSGLYRNFTSLHDTSVPFGTIDPRIGTYQCEVKLPSVPAKHLSPKLTVLKRGRPLEWRSYTLAGPKSYLKDYDVDLAFWSSSTRLQWINGVNLLPEIPQGQWTMIYYNVLADMDVLNSYSNIQQNDDLPLFKLEMILMYPSIATKVEYSPLFPRRGQRVFNNLKVINIDERDSDRCQNSTIETEDGRFVWYMDRETYQGYSVASCNTGSPNYSQILRTCIIEFTKLPRWDDFRNLQCLDSKIKTNDGVAQICPSRYYVLYEKMCIREYIRPNETNSWSVAKDTCTNDFAKLFIKPHSEQYFFVESEKWSDLTVHGKSGKILWKRNSKINDINYVTSRIGEENKCFIYNYTKTKVTEFSSDCEERKGFSCAISSKLEFLIQVPWCPQGWIGSDIASIKQKCYFLYFPQTHTYQRAEEHCRSLGSNLVVMRKELLLKFTNTFNSLFERYRFSLIRNSSFWSALIVKTGMRYWNFSNGLERFEYKGDLYSDDTAGVYYIDKSIDSTRIIISLLMDKKNKTHGFICEKSALKIHRSPRVYLTSRRNEERNCIEITCKGLLVHPYSWIYWYVNNERINEWNTISAFQLSSDNPFQSVIEETKCLNQTERSLQGEFYCEIGGSDSIPSVSSNKLMVFFPNSNRLIVSVNIKDDGKASRNRTKTMLKKLQNCKTSGIETEEIRLFQSESAVLNIVVHVENYGKNESWKQYESCIDKAKKKYSEMEFLYKSPSKCYSESTKIRDKHSKWNTLQWPTTVLNNIAESDKLCITAEGNIIRRKCSGDFIRGTFWETIKDECEWKANNRTISLFLLSKAAFSKENITEVADELWKLSKQTEPFLPLDVKYIARIMGKISNMDHLTEKTIENIASTVQRLMNTKESTLKIANNSSITSSSITKSVERILMKADGSVRIIKPSFYAESVIPQTQEIVGISSSFNNHMEFHNRQVELLKYRNFTISLQTAVALILPRNFKDYHSRTRFIIYNDSRLFPDSTTEKSINSLIISSTVEPIPDNLHYLSPVQLIFQPLELDTPLENSVCVFWDYSLNGGYGDWSEDGCWLDEIREGKLICLCTHLTHFAVLMQYDSTRSIDHTIYLSIITYIGCGLSISGLVLTILTFALFKKWRKKLGNKVLCNLSVSLLCAVVVFLAGIEQVNSPKTCIAVAVLLHYFLLVTFGWMLIEGVLHYLLFVRIFNSHIPGFIMKSMICAWGLPSIIIAIVLSIDVDLYRGSPHYCWMSRKAQIFSFLLPIGIIIALNAVFFILVIKSISCDRLIVSGKRRQISKQIFSAICVLVLLGLTWVFGFLAINVLFQYLFCVCSSLQGFLIFAFMVLRDNNAQDLWTAFVSKDQSTSTILSSFPKRNKQTDRH